jgi:WD40 repeat protein
VVFSPDSKRVASRDGSGAAKVWDVKTAREVLALNGLYGRIALSPDGKRLAATGDHGLVMIWDADSGE